MGRFTDTLWDVSSRHVISPVFKVLFAVWYVGRFFYSLRSKEARRERERERAAGMGMGSGWVFWGVVFVGIGVAVGVSYWWGE